MPNVLLITDSQRVKKIFDAVDATGILQLRTAATLAQAAQEIGEALPAITFLQSRVSGVSGELALLHLRKILPEGARIVLMTGSADELETGLREGERRLDLTVGDQELTSAIHETLSGVFAPPEPTPPPEPPTPLDEPAPEGDTDPFAGEKVSLSGKSRLMEPVSHEEAAEGTEPEPAVAPRADFHELLQGKEEQSATHEVPGLVGDFAYGRSLADALRAAEEQKSRNWLLPVAIGGIALSVLFFFLLKKGGHQKEKVAVAPPEVSKSVPKHGTAPAKRAVETASARDKHPAANPVASAKPAPPVSHPASVVSPAKPMPAPPPVKHPAPAPSVASVAKALPSSQAPSQGPQAWNATAKAVAPAPLKPAAPAPKETPKVVVPPNIPAPQPTQRPAPSFIGPVTLDPAYGKSHPGWERYMGAGNDFKIYREGGVLKALQVIAKGEDIPHPLLKRVLSGFAGLDGYRVKSRGQQEHYLVERGEGDRGVGVIVYRRKSDLRMKALVLYYR